VPVRILTGPVWWALFFPPVGNGGEAAEELTFFLNGLIAFNSAVCRSSRPRSGDPARRRHAHRSMCRTHGNAAPSPSPFRGVQKAIEKRYPTVTAATAEAWPRNIVLRGS